MMLRHRALLLVVLVAAVATTRSLETQSAQLAPAAAPSVPPKLAQYKQEAAASIDAMFDLAQQMVDSVFSFGEIGFQEHATQRHLTAILEREGLLAPAGIAAIEEAKANGSWSLLDAVERLEEPPDLAAALDAVPAAREHWNGFSPSSRKGILWWVVSAKRSETREKRIDQTVRMAAKGLRAQLDRE